MKKNLKKLTAFLCTLTLLVTMLIPAAMPVLAAPASSITMRVEGQKSTIYSGSVSFTQGENFYNIMAAALSAKGVELVAKDGAYGHEIVSLGGESGTYPVWWHLYVNGKASDVGADSLKPANGDEVVFYLGDDSVVLYPTITFTPKYAVQGEKTTVNVSASYTDYTDYTNPTTKSVKISGVTVSLDGKTYVTDANGNTEITMPQAGSYTMTATKEAKDTTPAIVRTGSMPFTVYTKDTVPKDSDPDHGGTPSKHTAVSSAIIAGAIKTGANYIGQSDFTDWNAALSYSVAGKTVPQSYLAAVREDIEGGGTALPTHLAGVIMGLKAAGANPVSFDGKDLVAQLYSSKNIGKTGLNGYAYSLLAFDCGGYAIPAGAAVTREGIIDAILSYQKPNGAFSLDHNTAADSDMTAIAITALAPYQSEAKVKAAVGAAVDYLSKTQQADGGYVPAYSSSESSETTAQVIIALSSAGVDAHKDARFIKNGYTALENLLSFYRADGTFSHVKGGEADLIATEQAVTALVAYGRFETSSARVYDLRAVSGKIENPKTGGSGAALPAITCVFAAAVFVLLKKRKAVQ